MADLPLIPLDALAALAREHGLTPTQTALSPEWLAAIDAIRWAHHDPAQ